MTVPTAIYLCIQIKNKINFFWWLKVYLIRVWSINPPPQPMTKTVFLLQYPETGLASASGCHVANHSCKKRASSHCNLRQLKGHCHLKLKKCYFTVWEGFFNFFLKINGDSSSLLLCAFHFYVHDGRFQNNLKNSTFLHCLTVKCLILITVQWVSYRPKFFFF